MSKCSCNCKKNYPETDIITCINCTLTFYYKCVGFTENNFKKLSKVNKQKWKCPICKSVKEAETDTDEMTNFSQKFKEELLKEVRRTISEELKEFMVELKDLRKSVEFFSLKIDEYNVQIEKYQSDNVQILKENDFLKKKLVDVESQLHELQQYTRSNNLEIHGIPVTKEEDVYAIIKDVAKSLKINHNETEIDIAHRIPTGKGKVQPIIVRFVNRTTKNQWLVNYRMFLKDLKLRARNEANGGIKTNVPTQLKTTHINRNLQEGPVYINENLSPYFKELFYNTKIYAKEHQYKYIWFRNGKIFLRRNEDVRPIRISTKADLEYLNLQEQHVNLQDSKSMDPQALDRREGISA